MHQTRRVGLAALVIVMLTAIAGPASAGIATQRKIIAIHVTGTQSATIEFEVDVQSRPACAVAAARMIFDLGTSKGRGFLSVATAALLGNFIVHAIGTNTCTTPSGGNATENLGTLTLTNSTQ